MSIASSCLGYALTAARHLRVQPPLLALSVMVGAAACYSLVPAYGLKGAVWAYGTAALVQLAGSALLVRRALGKIGSETSMKPTHRVRIS